MAIYWLNSVNLSAIDWVDTNLIEYFTKMVLRDSYENIFFN